jgi:hypothetical protein
VVYASELIAQLDIGQAEHFPAQIQSDVSGQDDGPAPFGREQILWLYLEVAGHNRHDLPAVRPIVDVFQFLGDHSLPV